MAAEDNQVDSGIASDTPPRPGRGLTVERAEELVAGIRADRDSRERSISNVFDEVRVDG